MKTLTKQEVSPVAITTLLLLKENLNACEEQNLLSGDQACDIFSDALQAIGKDFDWWCEQ